jgi:hypothetical protein
VRLSCLTPAFVFPAIPTAQSVLCSVFAIKS